MDDKVHKVANLLLTSTAIAFLGWVLACSQVKEQPPSTRRLGIQIQAGEKARNFGVYGYRMALNEQARQIMLLAADGGEIGSIVEPKGGFESGPITFVFNSTELSIRHHDGTFQIRDSDGTIDEVQPNGSSECPPGGASSDQLNILQAIVADLGSRDMDPVSEPAGGSSGSCNTTRQYQGGGGGLTRSGACAAATSDADSKCRNWNGQDCCSYVPPGDRCDCACLCQDFVCECIKRGSPAQSGMGGRCETFSDCSPELGCRGGTCQRVCPTGASEVDGDCPTGCTSDLECPFYQHCDIFTHQCVDGPAS